MNAKLYFESEKLVLQFGGQTIDIPLSVAKLQARFTPYPPSEMAWEEAIMQVEDLISPYRDVLKDYRVIELYHAEPLQILADENRQISTEIPSERLLQTVFKNNVVSFCFCLRRPHLLFCRQTSCPPAQARSIRTRPTN